METPKCLSCGYYGVTTEATLVWDYPTQQWLVSEETGYSTCGRCNESVDYEFVEVTANEYDENIENDEEENI